MGHDDGHSRARVRDDYLWHGRFRVPSKIVIIIISDKESKRTHSPIFVVCPRLGHRHALLLLFPPRLLLLPHPLRLPHPPPPSHRGQWVLVHVAERGWFSWATSSGYTKRISRVGVIFLELY
jgi:hypothetical protein